ncbi:hypothetical protein ACFVYE_32460 [Streptomyces sp. NPDC058239]|uniref:hypothetical protein n=1 Tax=Streptomyces sp. NPDC058239 TaxID=3346395 RepID=UPI0036E1C731
MTDIGAELAHMKKDIERLQRAARLGYASLDDTALEVRDGSGSLRALVGQQGDGTTAVNVVNGGTPPTPSTPSAGPALGGIAAGWDGTFAGGVVMPLDWARVEVHASPTAGFETSPSTLQATIETAQGGIVYVPATAPMYVRLLARNTSGSASVATDAVGPYAPRPVAGDIGAGEITATLIADGAVTTPKLIANAVTTAKLSAGSVDATALKADAITGKAISGGTVTGAVVTGGIVQTGSTGQRVVLNPQATNPDNPTLTVSAVELHSGLASQVTPGLLSSRVTDDASAYPYVSLRSPAVATAGPGGGGVPDQPIDSELLLLSSQPGVRGGSFRIDANRNPYAGKTGVANIYGYVGNTNADTSALQLACADGASAPGGSGTLGPSTAINMSGSEIQLRARNATADLSLRVRPTGVTVEGGLTVTGTTFTAYTPTVSNGGSATYSSRTGWYYKLGKMVYFTAEFVASADGSGTTAITVTAPSSIYRGTRQLFTCHAQGIYVSGLVANGNAVALDTGSGNVIDRISVSNNGTANRDNILNGSQLLNGATVTIQGCYREA